MTSINANAEDVLLFRMSGPNIVYSKNGIDQPIILSWPLTITNLDAASNNFVYVYFNDITIDDGNKYFNCGSACIQFGSTSLNPNGTRPTITISGVSGYNGLINNNDGSTGYNAIRVINLQMTGTGSPTLGSGQGWVCQYAFGLSATGNMIINCSTDATLTISPGSGGIMGSSAGGGAGARLEVIGCTSAGAIQGSSGGIVGQFAGQNGGRITISQCSSSGDIASEGGGIFGGSAGRFGGEAIAALCYSTGLINSGGGGGIYGSGAADSGSASATNCYSRGNILLDCGGIFGKNSDAGAVAIQCYSSGVISSGGGIFGASAAGTATNCYTSGINPISATGGIYAGSSADNAAGANNYSQANNGNSGEWNSTIAQSKLGSQWINLGSGLPFIFAEIGFTPYQTTNISFDASGNPFITDFAGNIVAGQTTGAAILTGGTYDLLNSPPSTITISASTGEITAAATTPAGTYTLTVRFSINPYSVTTYTLTVDEAAAAAAAATVCCVSLVGQSNLNYVVIGDVQAGKAMIAQQNNPKASYASYTDYLKTKIARAYGRR